MIINKFIIKTILKNLNFSFKIFEIIQEKLLSIFENALKRNIYTKKKQKNIKAH